MSALRVREMTLADCPRVAEIRVRGWQSAYKGLMPQSYLDALSVSEDAARRRGHLERADGSVVNLVAEREGAVVGWACHGPYRDGEAAPRTSSCTRSTSIRTWWAGESGRPSCGHPSPGAWPPGVSACCCGS